MGIKDKANEYNSYKEKILISLKDAKKIGIDVTIYKNMIESIDEEIELKVDEISHKKITINSFKQDTLSNVYIDGLNKLELLQVKIKEEIDNYYKIYYLIKDIEEYLKDSNQEELDENIEKTIKLLNLIEESSTIDYKTESNLFDNAYDVVYKMLLIESLNFDNNFNLLQFIKNHSTHANYMDVRLYEDLNTKFGEEKVHSIIAEKIGNEGFGYNLLDEKVITMVASKYSFNIIDNMKDALYDYVKRTKDSLEQIKKDKMIHEALIYEKQKSVSIQKDYIKRYAISRGILTALIAASIIGNVKAINNGTHDEYFTYTLEKDIDNEEIMITKDERYSTITIENEKIIEFGSWKKEDIDEEYIRESYEYVETDFASPNHKYDNSELSKKEIEMQEKIGNGISLTVKGPIVDTRKVLSDIDKFEENRIVIVKNIFDKDNTIKVKGIDKGMVDFLLLIDGVGLVLLVVFGSYIVMTYSVINNLPEFMSSLKEYKSESLDLKTHKKLLLECKKRFSELALELEDRKELIENDNVTYTSEDKKMIRKLSKDVNGTIGLKD